MSTMITKTKRDDDKKSRKQDLQIAKCKLLHVNSMQYLLDQYVETRCYLRKQVVTSSLRPCTPIGVKTTSVSKGNEFLFKVASGSSWCLRWWESVVDVSVLQANVEFGSIPPSFFVDTYWIVFWGKVVVRL